jgi:hypothetical protein
MLELLLSAKVKVAIGLENTRIKKEIEPRVFTLLWKTKFFQTVSWL